ncbi:MAG: metallophosphoesterase family protein [Anaerolineae bacterium]|nr:metallophosphoesterase family protein [Anaerolineae bacterium]
MTAPFRIGVLADTHMPHSARALPAQVLQVFQGVDLILHAGDLDEPCALDALKPLAPVIAVRGNLHLRFGTFSSPHLPKAVHLWIKNRYVVLNHGLPYFWRASIGHLIDKVGLTDVDLNQWMIRDQQHAFPGADLVIFGHSHLALIERHGQTLFVNPGTPIAQETKKRPSVALIEIGINQIEAEIVEIREQALSRNGQMSKIIGQTRL